MSDRQFYGGEAPGGATTGEISAGRYEGPEAHAQAPWKCPACKADQAGPIDDGCTSCGSGSAKARHVGVPPPAKRPAEDLSLSQVAAALAAPVDRPPSERLTIYQYALNWSGANPEATLADAFMAGYQYANAKTIGAPPVTVDLPTLAPASKPRRTIVAALQFFRDQILPRAVDEIASGEWCSESEIDQLIQQFTDEEAR